MDFKDSETIKKFAIVVISVLILCGITIFILTQSASFSYSMQRNIKLENERKRDGLILNSFNLLYPSWSSND